MDAAKPIIFYDIASGPPVRTFAPNPGKRGMPTSFSSPLCREYLPAPNEQHNSYALNFKGVHYRTEWVDLPNVTSVRKQLGAAPNRTLPDGSPFYTLPIIQDVSTGEIIGDSFEIAMYLDKTYPHGPRLLPPLTTGLHAAFNVQADATFSRFANSLMLSGIPFNPELADRCKATFVERSGSWSWEDMTAEGDQRAKELEAFKSALGELAKAYRFSAGPFLEGETPSYADLIVGAWLAFTEATLREWEDVQTWHDGLWKRIDLALEKWAEVK